MSRFFGALLRFVFRLSAVYHLKMARFFVALLILCKSLCGPQTKKFVDPG